MTDNRITDLSIGVLGRPSYGTEVGEWSFSKTVTLERSIQPLLPLKEHVSAFVQDEDDGPASQKGQEPPKNISRACPELYPAIGAASSLFSSFTELDSDIQEGSLFSIGRAVDHNRLSGSSTPLLFAIPWGDAGHVLRIVRPRTEKRGWGKGTGATIPLLVTESCDEAYYKIGTEGTIRQITFANEDSGSGTWLAVRQNRITTIFRVVYTASNEPVSSSSHVSSIRPSNLKPSSVVVLPAERSASIYHSDVTFNPLYTRQIGVVDPSGRWSIWDIEGRQGQRSSFKLVPGKAGGIYDDYSPDPALKLPDFVHTDGWHRILWACNVTTIIVCNRHHLAVFDLKSNPTRLDSTDFLLANGSDSILDIKRSSFHVSHIFVLTTSRIFWIEITHARKDEDGVSCGTKVILSYQHLRDEHDKTMRLAVVKDDYVSVLIYAKDNSIVNFYCFSSDTTQRQSAQGSFLLSPHSGEGGCKWKSWKAACFLPISLVLRASNVTVTGVPGPELKYLEKVRFLQPFILTQGLGLSTTLCATQDNKNHQLEVLAPTSTISQSMRRAGSRYITEPFIVPNEIDEWDSVLVRKRPSFNRGDDFLMDWRGIFQTAFSFQNGTQDPSANKNTNTILADISDLIRKGLAEDNLTTGTLVELSGLKNISENLEEVAQNLSKFFDSLPGNSENESELVVSDLTICPAVELAFIQNPKLPGLMNIYEQLVDKWMASLPLKVSNASRGSKFKIIRQIAVDLRFSSITISLQKRPSKTSATLQQKRDEDSESAGPTTRESSPATIYSSQASVSWEQNPNSALPTPTRTQSVYSQATSASELTEDPAITRLRQYVISIKSRPDIGQSKLLSEWPSTPGTDPATYSYKPPVIDDGDEESQKARREAARRKRRTERFLKHNAEASSQASATPFGSQPPQVPHFIGFSSQPVEELPMTQPDTGPFGSRSMRGKKKHKKHRAAGF